MANILIVGNGFDLAHNLPTNYSDYLKQLKRDSDFYAYVNSSGSGLSSHKLNNLINGVVCKYLLAKMSENKGWIDFELEVKEIVESIASIEDIFDRKINLDTKKYYYTVTKEKLESIPIFLLRYIFRGDSPKLRWEQSEIIELKDEVLKHIKIFIYYFEKYLIWIFDNSELIKSIPLFNDMFIDYFLTFNYTDTFERLYNNGHKCKKILYDEDICYVHGQINNHEKIVMGIGSEFYDENTHENYVELFKFFQRYRYETDCKFQEWINILSKEYKEHSVTIYGHSLDPTDKDILKPFLLLPKVKITIFYYKEENKLTIEKNLLKTLNKELFEKYLIGSEKRIYLKKC